MKTFSSLEEFTSAVGTVLGTSAWLTIEQERVDLFAEATGDHQWIHVDPESAAQGPFGTTIAHGYLTLSLIPALLSEVFSITDSQMGVNYGVERARFTSPVPSGSDVRLKATLHGTERRPNGVLFRLGVEIEIRDHEKPALVGEVLYLAYE